MASKKILEAEAAKARKQKIVLIVGAVLLAAVAAFQVPRLMGGGSTQAAPATTTADVSGAATGVAPAAPTPPTVVVAGKSGAVVAGVSLPRGGVAMMKATDGQLASFTLFEVKDPFVPQVDDGLSPTQDASGGAAPAAGTTGGSPAGAGAGGGDSGSTAAPAAGTDTGSGSAPEQKPAPIVYATIDYNGKPQQLKVKDDFPDASPLFVLRSLTKKEAKIAVAGGSFDDRATLTLTRGKKVTLVNTATGVRYVLKLVYTGAEPEVIESFTTTAPSGAAASAGGTTTPATTTSTTSG